MERTKQITVSLGREPGRLARLCLCLADRAINLLAISVAETSEQSLVRLVVDKPDEAAKMLDECPLTYTLADVLLLELPTGMEAMAEAAQKLTTNSVDVSYIYGSAARHGGTSFIVLGLTNPAKAEKALR